MSDLVYYLLNVFILNFHKTVEKTQDFNFNSESLLQWKNGTRRIKYLHYDLNEISKFDRI